MKAFFASLLLLVGLSVCTIAAQQPSQVQSRAKCLQKCLDDFQDNMDDCEDSCFTCDVWILFCVAGHTNKECLETCSAGAQEVYEACKAECPPQPQPLP